MLKCICNPFDIILLCIFFNVKFTVLRTHAYIYIFTCMSVFFFLFVDLNISLLDSPYYTQPLMQRVFHIFERFLEKKNDCFKKKKSLQQFIIRSVKYHLLLLNLFSFKMLHVNKLSIKVCVFALYKEKYSYFMIRKHCVIRYIKVSKYKIRNIINRKGNISHS